MSTEDNDIDGKTRLKNIILILLFCLTLGWFNYTYFIKHISSNPERINNFIAEDNNLDKFRIPVTAVFFYPYDKSGKRIFSSQTSPQMMVVPSSGYLYSERNLQKAYQRLLPWKGKIKNVILVPIDKQANLKEQTKLIKSTFGTQVNLSQISYNSADMENMLNFLRPYVSDDKSLLIFITDVSGHYTEQNQNSDTSVVVQLAQEEHLYPKVYDLVNFEDVAEQNYRLLESKKAQPLTTLEQEVESLTSFAKLYGADLLKIAEQALPEAVLRHKQFHPERKDFDDVLFNRGAAYVSLFQNKVERTSGSLLPTEAIAFTVAQNTYKAALEDAESGPINPEKLSSVKIKISLLSGFERVENKSEAYILKQIKQNIDGLVIRDGNRQGVFLPSMWQQYQKKQDFLNNLKIKAGMSPTYWSNSIKIYKFRAVEISKDEN